MGDLLNRRVLGSVWHILTGNSSGDGSTQDSCESTASGNWWEVMEDRPFVARVPRPLNYHDKIIISGKIADAAELFSINLCCDPVGGGKSVHNIAYHSKAVFGEEPRIFTNHKQNGVWGDEAVSEVHSNPYQPGEDFRVEINLMPDEIVSYNNDSFVDMMSHRLDISRIETVQLWHHVEHVSEITFRFHNG